MRQGLRISHPRYGLKNVEQFYMEREAELRSGDDSIVLYERWVDERDDSILDGIEAYNREDCLSTYLLREWLLERKAEAQAAWGTEIPWRAPPELREIKPEAEEELAEREALARGAARARRRDGSARGAAARVPPARGEAGLVGVLPAAGADGAGADRGRGVDRRARVGRAGAGGEQEVAHLHVLVPGPAAQARPRRRGRRPVHGRERGDDRRAGRRRRPAAAAARAEAARAAAAAGADSRRRVEHEVPARRR